MQILPKLFGEDAELRSAGLDLNDSGIGWVELRKDKARGLVLERCLFEALAPGCIVKGQIVEFADVDAALTRLLAGPNAAPAPRVLAPLALAVPDAMATVHQVSFPAKLSEAVLAERLQADMAARLRLSDDAVCVDFVVRPWSSVDKAAFQTQTNALAAAVPREAVEDRLALVESAALPWRVDGMALASQAAVSAVCRAIQAKEGKRSAVTALVQLAPGWLQLDILQRDQVLRSERFSLQHFPSTAAEPCIAWPEGLDQALEAADGSTSAGRPVQLWLTGPAELSAAWAATLQERTGLPCVLVDPFEGMLRAETLDDTHRLQAAQTLVACGLALMALKEAKPRQPAPQQPSFNFLPHRKAAFLRRQKAFVTQLGAVALCVLLASALLRVGLSDKLEAQQNVQAEVRQEVAGLDAELQRLTRAQDDTKRLQLHADVLASFAEARQLAPLKWQELSTLLPDGLHLTSFRQEADGAAILGGQARSAAEVFGFIEGLAAGSQYFKRPELLDLSVTADPATLPATPATPVAVLAAAPVALSQAPAVERVVFTLRTQQP